MVLGLNDSLVELTGSLAGFTFAMQNTKIIALSGLIIGVSATFSMAASEFLSARSEGRNDAFKSCLYTGIAYLVAVALLILPYLLLPTNAYILALICMLAIVILIIPPVPTNKPILAETHNRAAVVIPLTLPRLCKIVPAPKKPTPETTWAIIRDLSCVSGPTTVDCRIANKQLPSDTNKKVT